MRAAVYSGYGSMPELAQVADPACPADGAVMAAMDGPAQGAGMTVIKLR